MSPLITETLKQLPGWKCSLIRRVPVFINLEGQMFRLVEISDPFEVDKSEMQLVSEDCFPARRQGLIKVAEQCL